MSYFERYEDLLATGGVPAADLDEYRVDIFDKEIRRARFSLGPIMDVEVTQVIVPEVDSMILVDLAGRSPWMKLFLKYEDDFEVSLDGGIFAVTRDGLLDDFSLTHNAHEHGPLIDACKTGLLELGLGIVSTHTAL